MKYIIGVIICLIILLSGCPSTPQPSPPNLDDTEGFDEIWYEWLDPHLETCPNCDKINQRWCDEAFRKYFELWAEWENERDLSNQN